jgi:phosphate transport system substrate-binding protein
MALGLSACGAPAEEVVLAERSEAPAAAPVEQSAARISSTAGRQGLRIVGSSTVFPFVTTVAENFGARSGFPTPVVEATGTGGGMNLFCAGLGMTHPDFTAASRPMKASEFQLCQENGVTAITEIPIGFDGIVLGNSVDSEPMSIAKRDLFLALAARTPMPLDAEGAPLMDESGALLDSASFAQAVSFDCETLVDNPFERWSDVNSDLPASRIEVFGPPPTSGTRDAFVELDMIDGARRIECLAEMEDSAPGRFDEIAARIREDGGWVDAGENDNTIVQTLANAPNSFGIFGYSFLEQNGDRIQAATIDGILPTYEAISNGEYPGSRSLYLYVKTQHDGVVPGLTEFVEELTSEEAWGPFGYLSERGLIALPEERRVQTAAASRALTPMAMPD